MHFWKRSFRFSLTLTLVLLAACGRKGAMPDEAAWIRGSTDERFAVVARHLRGLDVAMIEIGHRYQELHWAIEDRNWDYAKYQVTKIRLALDHAVERRPKRAPSAKASMAGTLAQLEEAVAGKDAELSAARFEALTVQCNGCHNAENVAAFVVTPPEIRTSAIRSPK